jgi:hypothetical protein
MEPDRLVEIKQQIAQLEWRRKQNDRLLRIGLDSAKSLKQKDALIKISQNNLAIKSTWQTAVIRDELSRPLVLSDEEMSTLISSNKMAKTRLSQVNLLFLNYVSIPSNSFFIHFFLLLSSTTKRIVQLLQS